MGTKNGTWVPSYQSFDDHEKTARLSASLVGLGVPESFASDVVWGQWKRLAFWLLANGTDGRLLATTPRAFAHILRWDDVRKAKALWDAWMDSGFIDEPNTENARLHDFREAFAHIISARERSANLRARKYAVDQNSSRTVRELSENDSRTVRPPRVRASGPDRTNIPLPPSATVPHPGQGGGIEPEPSPSRTAEGAPPTAPKPTETRSEGTDTPSLIAAAWNAARARRGLPPVDAADLGPALDVLAKAAPGEPAAQADLAAAYVGLDDDWLAERGWAPWALRNRVDALLVARRSRTVTPPVHASEAIVLPRVPGATAAELRPYARPASQPFTAAEEEEIAERIRGSRAPAAPSTPRWRPAVAAAEGAAP